MEPEIQDDRLEMDEFCVEQGSLHNGLAIDFRTGIITGVPQEGGERSLVVRGVNSKYGAIYGAVSRIRMLLDVVMAKETQHSIFNKMKIMIKKQTLENLTRARPADQKKLHQEKFIKKSLADAFVVVSKQLQHLLIGCTPPEIQEWTLKLNRYGQNEVLAELRKEYIEDLQWIYSDVGVDGYCLILPQDETKVPKSIRHRCQQPVINVVPNITAGRGLFSHFPLSYEGTNSRASSSLARPSTVGTSGQNFHTVNNNNANGSDIRPGTVTSSSERLANSKMPNFHSIQEAVNRAEDYTIIKIAPGNYCENVTVNKNVVLLGAEPKQVNDKFRRTVIEGSVRVVAGAEDAVLRYLTLRSGPQNAFTSLFQMNANRDNRSYGAGATVRIESGCPTIDNCDIGSDLGCCVYCVDASPTLTDNLITYPPIITTSSFGSSNGAEVVRPANKNPSIFADGRYGRQEIVMKQNQFLSGHNGGPTFLQPETETTRAATAPYPSIVNNASGRTTRNIHNSQNVFFPMEKAPNGKFSGAYALQANSTGVLRNPQPLSRATSYDNGFQRVTPVQEYLISQEREQHTGLRERSFISNDPFKAVKSRNSLKSEERPGGRASKPAVPTVQKMASLDSLLQTYKPNQKDRRKLGGILMRSPGLMSTNMHAQNSRTQTQFFQTNLAAYQATGSPLGMSMTREQAREQAGTFRPQTVS